MTWLALARGLIGLAVALVGWASGRGAVDPAGAEAARRCLKEALDAVDLALAARRRLDRDLLRDPGRLRADDGHRRD